MTNLEDELGDIVAKARLGLNYTPDQLAHMTTMTVDEIREIESYQFTPDHERLRALAESLSLDPEKLIAIANGSWQPEETRLPEDKFLVETVLASYGGYAENSYVFLSSVTGSAVVVDPGGAANDILSTIAERKLKLEAILITHAHADHTGAIEEIITMHPDVRVVGHPLELQHVEYLPLGSAMPVEDYASIQLADLGITALHTPGHTPGSTCYLTDHACFVGDTLFAGSIGRPATHGSYRNMLEVIREKILSLPEGLVIYPGHGPATTVGEERAHNPFFIAPANGSRINNPP